MASGGSRRHGILPRSPAPKEGPRRLLDDRNMTFIFNKLDHFPSAGGACLCEFFVALHVKSAFCGIPEPMEAW